MFARTLLSARNAAKAIAPRRSMGSVADFKPPTMADLPVPQGSWKDANSAMQRKNNLHLVAGILFSAATLAYVKESDLINFGFGPKIGK